MSDTTVLQEDIEAYVTAVGRHLTDLPDDDRSELLDELRGHATALRLEEPDVDLEVRLGSASAYARELRDAAGLPERGPRTLTLRSRAVKARLRSSRVAPVVTRFVTEMSPLGWALRGAAIAWLVLALTARLRTPAHGFLVVAVALAAWLAAPRLHRWARPGVRRLVLRAVDVVTVLVIGLLCVQYVTDGTRTPEADSSAALPASAVVNNGNPVTQIHVVGADGSPLTVALYDQDGTPLDTQSGYDAIACPDDASSLPIPYRDASGQILTNVYPLRAICVDANGAVVAPLTTSPTTLPTTIWASPEVPLVGQHVELDADGNYSGVLVTPSPSPTPPEGTPSASSPSTNGGSGSPTPSKS
jgi:hypothetical protein